MEIPKAFRTRKQSILAGLAVPEEQYQDRSPKGSVDVGIRDLIELLNGFDGLVTTSSCAGRVSLFIEGAAKSQSGSNGNMSDHHTVGSQEAAAATSNAKGLGGHWLFVTHDADDLVKLPSCFASLDKESLSNDAPASTAAKSPTQPTPDAPPRLIQLQFEPMILHVQAASLTYARPLLGAAVISGWRESGVNSLRCLENPTAAFPIVAVRSTGLALGTVVGYIEPSTGQAKSLVSQQYVESMASIFRDRFRSNTARIARFEEEVRKAMIQPLGKPSLKGAKDSSAKVLASDADISEVRRARLQEANRLQEEDFLVYDGLSSLESGSIG